MNPRALPRHLRSTLLAACAATLLLSACLPRAVIANQAPVQAAATELPTDTAQPPAATLPPAEPTQLPANPAGDFNLDLSILAPGQAIETVAAVPPADDQMWWVIMPEYRLVTLDGYPVTGHTIKPQVFIYPLDELAEYNKSAGQAAADLQSLLESRRPAEKLPYLPLYNSLQATYAKVEYLDFKNGAGVRYLTQYNQGLVPINNTQLIYTFQGLTGDGKYYVAVVLPVTHPELPADRMITMEEIDEANEYTNLIADTTDWLNLEPGSHFIPGLEKLDELVESMEVR